MTIHSNHQYIIARSSFIVFFNRASMVFFMLRIRLGFQSRISIPDGLQEEYVIIRFDYFEATTVDKLPTDMEGMEATMERMLALIDDTYKYVGDVVKCLVAPDNNVGKFISETILRGSMKN
ncbi:hypothetical protein Ccrd_017044 [Cynara cardunculus var. scolymus]|uniref:EIF3F/CSN6-like C-terminal domain-containing protein n=1 Tax=Cynara cardunculus var. scolymus TaxID=59895 RepID=A0A103Y8U5_CYNCS|nr:hypothetical protein Ccrd_017044 [Cynara cardunculus var. scolymus]